MSPKIPPEICAYCKGVKKLCGAKICPILLKFDYLKEDIFTLKSKNVMAVSPPDFLVGEYGYPSINFGPISNPLGETEPLEEMVRKRKIDLIDVLKIRLNHLFSYSNIKVSIARKPDYPPEPIKELAISVKPVDTELELLKLPRPRVFLDPEIPPVGLRAPLKRLDVVDNSYAPRKLEAAVDEDEKAEILAHELFKHGISNYHIMRMLSLGLLGRKHRRKLVPTRWAITAIDSLLGNRFLESIRYSPSLSLFEIYHHRHLGNEYYISMIPSDYWAFEMFEIWMPMSVWVRKTRNPVVIHIFETYDGKPNKIDGGYYAIRFSVLEKLAEWNRIAKVIAVRIIHPEYFAGVGSWQIREGVRLALNKKPLFRGEIDEATKWLFERVKNITGLELEGKSKVIKMLKEKKLTDFL